LRGSEELLAGLELYQLMYALAPTRFSPVKTLYTDTDINEYFRALTGFQPRQFQTETIHKILNRQDVLLRAPTGLGKTETACAPFLFCVSGMDLFGGRFGNSLQSKFSIARIGQIVRYNQLFWQARLLFSVFARSRTQITPEPLW
jgi:hypothetical protein